MGLLCVLVLFYISQLLVLPRTPPSTHICFIFAITITGMVSILSLANKITVSSQRVCRMRTYG